MESLTLLGLIAIAAGVVYGVCSQDDYATSCQQVFSDAKQHVNGMLEPYEPWQVR